jgi:transposase
MRVWVATEARALGRGGIALVARATGISTSTIGRGLRELRSRVRLPPGRVRRPGGGRKRTIDKDPTLLRDLEGLVEPTTSGAPDSPLRWTAKSTRTLARTLQSMGHRVSHQLVRELLSAAGYSLQANRKTREGPPHPPGRPVPPHHRAGPPVPGRGPAGDLGRHEGSSSPRRPAKLWCLPRALSKSSTERNRHRRAASVVSASSQTHAAFTAA